VLRNIKVASVVFDALNEVVKLFTNGFGKTSRLALAPNAILTIDEKTYLPLTSTCFKR